MIDDPETRSRTMRAVKAKDTKPEMIVRRLVHAMGYRYRLHRKSLPGQPDLVFPRLRKIIFVHGCFWHGHDCARGSRTPLANRTYWKAKISRNCQRDAKNIAALEADGWRVEVVWECELKDKERARRQLASFLS